MALDPNIILAGAAQPTVQMQTPLDTFMKGLSLRAMVNQDQSRQLQMQMQQQQLKQAQQSYQDQQNLRSLFASNANPNAQQIYAAGGPMAGMQIVKGMTEAQQAAANLQKTKGDIATQENDFLGKVAGAVRANNYSPDSIRQAFQLATNAGYGQHVQQIAAQIQANPASAKQIFDGLYQSAMSAKDQAATQAQMIAANARADQAKESARHNGVTEQQAATNAAEVARNNAFNNQAKVAELKIGQQNANANALRADIDQKTHSMALQALTPPTPNLAPGERDENFLKTLPPATALMVKAISDGRMDLSTGMLRTPVGQNLAAAVNRYDSSFDAGNAPARFALNKDFRSGKAAQNLRAIDTLAGHLNALQQSSDQVGGSDFKPLNWIESTATQAVGSPAIKAMNTNATAVFSDAAAVFKGQATEGEINRFAKDYNVASTPSERQAIITKVRDLVASRAQAMMDTYKAGMGRDLDTSQYKHLGDFLGTGKGTGPALSIQDYRKKYNY